MRKLSIRTKLILVCGILLIVPILALGIVTYQVSGNETNALIEKDLKNNVKLASEIVNSLNKAV
jgi:methyl-accepting chemotaxis protein